MYYVVIDRVDDLLDFVECETLEDALSVERDYRYLSYSLCSHICFTFVTSNFDDILDYIYDEDFRNGLKEKERS